MLNEIDLSRVDLNLLVLFDTVLRERHVGRAGERLSLTPSAISHGLGRLRRLLNDPLFLRTPRGVVPTDRALALADPVADLLTRMRGMLATAAPFDPSISIRRFMIGAPDGLLAVLLPRLVVAVTAKAPGIDLGARHILREAAIEELDTRGLDIAIVPLDEVPSRFAHTVVQDEGFVIAARAGHPFLDEPTLEAYCAVQHVVVSVLGEPRAYVDGVLEAQGLTRRVAVSVPNFMLALALLAETDLVAALPLSLVAMHAPRFGLGAVESPIPMRSFQLRAIVPKAALTDTGIAWLNRQVFKALAS